MVFEVGIISPSWKVKEAVSLAQIIQHQSRDSDLLLWLQTHAWNPEIQQGTSREKQEVLPPSLEAEQGWSTSGLV